MIVAAINKGRLARKFLIGLALVFVLGVSTFLVVFRPKVQTLATLRQVDEYPLLTMTYYGDYGFDDFLKVGASSDSELEKFVTKQLIGGRLDLNPVGFGCTAFSAVTSDGEHIYGRNFDWTYSPALLLKTSPSNGYASISIVNLSFLGYGRGNLPSPRRFSSLLTLAAPYLPFEGMNERGLVVAVLTVPQAEPPRDEGKITLTTSTAIRLVLDKAANVEEAVDLLKGYNYHFSGDIKCHYLLADSLGRAVVVEFMDGAVQVIESDEPYHIATNFVMYNELNIGHGQCEFERYDIVKRRLSETSGIVSEKEAMTLLDSARTRGATQWSTVYNQHTGKVMVSMNMKYEQVYKFELAMVSSAP